EEPQVGEQIDDLLLAEVPAARRAIRGQPRLAELLLVPLGVGSRGEEEHDLAGGRRARVDELTHAPRDVPRLCATPVRPGAVIAGLVGDEELDRMADRVRELARRGGLLELVAEMRAEELVHGREHLRPRAVVLRQRPELRRARTPLTKDGDVRMAEAVDRLELVTDEEDFGRGPAEEIHELALQAIRVLELVDHDRPEPQ